MIPPRLPIPVASLPIVPITPPTPLTTVPIKDTNLPTTRSIPPNATPAVAITPANPKNLGFKPSIQVSTLLPTSNNCSK